MRIFCGKKTFTTEFQPTLNQFELAILIGWMGIAVNLKKTFLILCLAISITGCVKKETPDFGKNDEVNKAYTDDNNGEMIFYDLKKPALEAKVEVVKNDHGNLSELLLNDLKDKVNLLDEINVDVQPNLTNIIIKLNKINEFGDGYLGQMKHEVPLVLKAISIRSKDKAVSATLVQGFDDGSSLNIYFKGGDLSTISEENLFIRMKISNKDVKGDAKKFLNLICDTSNTDSSEYKFCKNDVTDKDQMELKKTKTTKAIDHKDGIEKLIEDNTSELANLKKEHSLSEDQKKILQDAGFEITLNE